MAKAPLPTAYAWLARETGPRVLVEALDLFGTRETPGAASNPAILGWAKEVGVAGAYVNDGIAWCGLFVATVVGDAPRAGEPCPPILPGLSPSAEGSGPDPAPSGPFPEPVHKNHTEGALASFASPIAEAAPDAAARRDAARDRRIALGRARPAPAMTVAAGSGSGNGAPPDLTPLAELSAIGALLYGDRWTTDVARDLGVDPREIRRLKAGQATVKPGDVLFMRGIARKRATTILRLVGDGLDAGPAPKRDPAAIRAAFEATIAAARQG